MHKMLTINSYKLGLTVVLLAVFTFMAGLVFWAPEASAQIDSVREGVGQTGDANSGTANSQVESLVETAVDLFSLVVGIIAVIMIIVGGLKYIMASGDPSNLKGAKDTILYAIIGLVIVVFAQIIVLFVLNETEPSSNGGEDGSSSTSSLIAKHEHID